MILFLFEHEFHELNEFMAKDDEQMTMEEYLMSQLVDDKDDGDEIITLARGYQVWNADGSVTDVSNDPRYKCKKGRRMEIKEII